MIAPPTSDDKGSQGVGSRRPGAGVLAGIAVTSVATLALGWWGVDAVLAEAARTDADGLARLGFAALLALAGMLAAHWLVVAALLRYRPGSRTTASGSAPSAKSTANGGAADTSPDADLKGMLRDARERLKSITASIPGVIYQRRVGPDGDIRYTYISDGAKDLFGVSPEEIISDPKALFDCHGPEYRDTFRERLLQASRDLTMWDVEAQIIKRNGEEMWTHAIARPQRQPDGSVLWDGVILDATRIKRAEIALHSAKEQAEAANRAKSEFLGVISHEIRTPLNGILGMAELMGRTNLTDRQSRYMNTITQSGEALLSIVNDILDITKIEAGEQSLASEIFSLRQCVADVVSLFRGMAERKRLALTDGFDDELPALVRGDPVRLRQILANLINNAVKFTNEGDVSIDVRLQGRSDGAASVVFEVSDTGIGIPEEHRSRLFEPFHQVDSSYSRKQGGTGLGLTITHHLVEMMNGEIEVRSEEGRGSTFQIVIPLPVVEETLDTGVADVSETDAVDWPESDAPPTKIRALVAEDNVVNQEVILENLWAMGCEADTALNGLEAVEAFEQNAYDIILMDCQMPEMDGFEATRKIREIELVRNLKDGKRHHIPIIAVSAHTMAGDREHCLLVGMDDHLGKPFTFDQLQGTINFWLKKSDRRAVDTA